MNQFSKNLRALRKQYKMTQKDLAAKLGLAFSTISMYERGEREPDFETIEAIARLFDVDMNYLMGCPEHVRPITDEDIKFALFGADSADEITDDMFEDVKRFAQFLKEKKR